MTLFRYVALDRSGKELYGAMDEPDAGAVSLRLETMGLTVKSLGPAQAVPDRTVSLGAPPAATGYRGKQPTARDWAIFYRQLAAMSRAGINPDAAMQHIGARLGHRGLRETSAAMVEAVRGGGRLSTVMAANPYLYSEHATATVRSGEMAGRLDLVLDDLAAEYELRQALFRNSRIMVSTLVSSLLGLVIAMPLASAAVTFMVAPVWNHLIIAVVNMALMALLLGCIYAGYFWLQQPRHRPLRDRLVLRVPRYGAFVLSQGLFSFLNTLRRLYLAGISPTTAWEAAMNVPANTEVRARLSAANELLKHGTPIADAFASTQLFDSNSELVFMTGIVTGEVAESLEKISEYYHSQMSSTFDNVRAFMVRCFWLLVIVLGLLMPGIMLRAYFDSMFTTVFNSFSS